MTYSVFIEGSIQTPFESVVTIEADDEEQAVQKARAWAKSPLAKQKPHMWKEGEAVTVLKQVQVKA